VDERHKAEMSRFYLTLPSNSSTTDYPDNMAAHYVTKLDGQTELEGQWEVGLVEISHPGHLYNVGDGDCYMNVFVRGRGHCKVILPPGYYKNERKLLEALHEVQRALPEKLVDGKLFVQFSYMRGRVSFVLNREAYPRAEVAFSKRLARLLGFDMLVEYGQNMTAVRASDVAFGDIQSAYVYCDLPEHVVVGDMKAPLLGVVDLTSRTPRNVHQVANPILYVPLQIKNFDTVEIKIVTNTGQIVPFADGHSYVVLEFRRAVHPLFGL